MRNNFSLFTFRFSLLFSTFDAKCDDAMHHYNSMSITK